MAARQDNKDPDPAEIRAQLDRVLSTPVFINADRVAKFLEYVVKETLAGRAGRIKQYTVAVEGLGDAEDFDPSANPAIRILARRVRRALQDYYREAGVDDPVIIDIPKGTYVPNFTLNRRRGQASTVVADSSAAGLPRVAVLPFASAGEDEAAERFARGITVELTTGLTAFQGLEVIGWHTAEHYADVSAPLGAMRRDLDVSFALAGSVRIAANAIKVTSELVDTATDSVLWAASAERDLSTASVFEVMDEITAGIVASVGDYHGVITRRMVQRSHATPAADLTAYEATLRFHDYIANISHERFTATRAALERAVEIDPGYSLAWAQLAELHCDSYCSWQETDRCPDEAFACASRALALDPTSQDALTVSAYAHYLNREHGAAIRDAEAGIKLNPRASFQVAWAGWLMGLSGDVDRGRRIIEDMERLNPHQPGWLRGVAFVAEIEQRNYEACLHEAERIGIPDHPIDPLLRAVAAGHTGNQPVAAAAYRDLRENFPEIAANPLQTIRIFFHFPRWEEAMVEGLQKACALADGGVRV